jgi:predicted MFS family arabinose efflux permease
MTEAKVDTRKSQPEERLPDRAGADAGQRATFGEVFRVAEFRALWTASLLSLTGDQLARVAITVLVYERTRSALLAAVAFATSIVPTFVGGVTLSGLADRLPRRRVMIVTDVASGVLVAVMALPGMPLAVLLVLLFAVTMLSAPYMAARAGILPDVLAGDRYVAGLAVAGATAQFALVAGSAAGGAAVALLGARGCLAADALTFALSAVLIRARVRARPAARPQRANPPGPAGEGTVEGRPPARGPAGGGLRLVLGSGEVRTALLLAWLAAFIAVPEGLAVPLARSAGGGAVTAGLILAALAAGAVAGFSGISRLVDPAQRVRWIKPLAVASCATLTLMALHPPVGGMLAILAACGVLTCYQIPVNALWVRATPPGRRSQVSGIVNAGLGLGQGGGMIVAGAVAGRIFVPDVVAVSGALGMVCALAITLTARSHRRSTPRRGPGIRPARRLKHPAGDPGTHLHM